VNALSRANRRTEHARRAVLYTVGGFDIVHAAEAVGIVSALFRVLDRNLLREEHVLHRDREALHDFEKIKFREEILFGFKQHNQITP
jgi:hypothetical protein